MIVSHDFENNGYYYPRYCSVADPMACKAPTGLLVSANWRKYLRCGSFPIRLVVDQFGGALANLGPRPPHAPTRGEGAVNLHRL